MKKILLPFLILLSINVNAQIDTIITYSDILIYVIDTPVYYGNDTSPAPNFVKFNYHYISLPDTIWESQLIIVDSTGKYLVPINTLIESGAGGNGTTWFTGLDSTDTAKDPMKLCDSLFLPKYNLYIGTTTKTE